MPKISPTTPVQSGTGQFPPPSDGTDAVLQLEALLGLHSLLAADMMRARIRTDADLAQSANAALGQNADALSDLLQPVMGTKVRDRFAEAWTEHIQALFKYSRGLATKKAEVREDARQDLSRYEQVLARLFADQSDGRLKLAAAQATLGKHINHLVEGVDTYAAKNYPASAKIYQQTYAQAFQLGAVLGSALWPANVGKELNSPTVALRSALTQLLGEHAALMMATVRSSIGNRDDFEAMGAAVNANTLSLTAAFDSLFGPAAARRFQAGWADHVDHLLAYTAATAKKDAAGQQNARQGMRSFETSFAAFLNTATQNRIPEEAMVGQLGQYDGRLLAEIDAYVSNDHERAQVLREQIYGETFVVAQQLSTAIGATLATRLPRGGSQTGGGGGVAVRMHGG